MDPDPDLVGAASFCRIWIRTMLSESVTSVLWFLLRQSWSGGGRERHLHQVTRVETVWRHFPGHEHSYHQTSHQPQVWCETEPIHD